jgi:Uma2 family endonuclease
MSSLSQPRSTLAHYLVLERQAKHRSEYINGSIFAMAGASRQHNLIVGNVFGELRAQLRGRPCEAYINDAGQSQRHGFVHLPGCGRPLRWT